VASNSPSAHPALRPIAGRTTKSVSVPMTGLWFLGTLLLGVVAIYFLGIDQGSVSVTGKGMLLHEFFHDARHSLGFPCH
jgi:hypothetical protein